MYGYQELYFFRQDKRINLFLFITNSGKIQDQQHSSLMYRNSILS